MLAFLFYRTEPIQLTNCATQYKKNMSKNTRTINDMINRYISEYLPREGIENQRNKIIHLAWWKKEIGDYLLSQARPCLFVECRNKLLTEKNGRGKIRGPSTINHYFSTLSRIFSVAIKEWEWLDGSPLRNISKLEEPAGRTRFLSKEELYRLLLMCEESTNKNLYLTVVLSLSTCTRKSEIMWLRWIDVDLVQGVIVLRKTKNGTIRTVPLQAYALKLMRKKWEISDKVKEELIFPSKTNRCKPVDLRYHWFKALHKANIKDFRWHDLRHTGASYLLMSGASLTELSDVLGHKTLQMVKRYAHLSLPHTIKIVTKMNRKMFSQIE